MIGRITMTAVGFFLCLAGAPGASAETEVTVSGQVRARTEVERRTFETDARTNDFSLLRTRLAIKASADSNVSAFVQFQDSRELGGVDLRGNANSGTLNNGANVDIHQAYLQVEQLWENGPGLRAGRFEVNLGNQRVFGSVGWSNVGRSWEGLWLWRSLDEVTFGGYWLKKLTDTSTTTDSEFDILGVTVDVKKAGLQLLAFYESDESLQYSQSADSDINALDRFSTGAYFNRVWRSIDVTANAVYQFGNRRVGADSSTYREVDIAAFLLAAEIGYSFECSSKPRLAVGIDYTSGDSDSDDDTWKAYDNLYYTGHAFRGYMDYFIGSGPAGLVDAMLRVSLSPLAGWTVKADAHYFQTAADYVDFQDQSTKDVGTEIDLTVSTKRIAGVTLSGGGSLFAPSESFAGVESPKTGLWGFLMLTADF